MLPDHEHRDQVQHQSQPDAPTQDYPRALSPCATRRYLRVIYLRKVMSGRWHTPRTHGEEGDAYKVQERTYVRPVSTLYQNLPAAASARPPSPPASGITHRRGAPLHVRRLEPEV